MTEGHDNHPRLHNTLGEESQASGSKESQLNKLSVDEETVGMVYDLWYAGLPGNLEIRPIPNKQYSSDRQTRQACSRSRTSISLGENSKAEFVETVKQIAKDPEMAHVAVCFGICPRNASLRRDWDTRAWIGGRSKDVEIYPGVVYDLDDHKAEDSESLSHGAEMLHELSLKGVVPTFKVMSGSGRGEHGYIRYRNPVDVATGNRIIRKLAKLLPSDLKITDPAHVMRIPGTWNSKNGSVVPVTIFGVTGELYDPVEVETAIELVARENGIDLSETAYSRSHHKSEKSDGWPSIKADEARRITEVCTRMAYYATSEGANSMSYWEWFGMATVLHSLSPNDSRFFEEMSRKYDGHDPEEIRQKWKDVRNTSPVSCAWFQSERPMEVCKTCRFFKQDEEGETI